MNKIIQTGIIAICASVLCILGHFCGWGVEGQSNAWLLNPIYVAAVSGIFFGSGLTSIILGFKLSKWKNS